MLAMHCTEISALEKILGLHYSHFQIPLLVSLHPYERLLPKNCYFSMRVEKSRLKTFLEHNPFEGRVSESDAIRALRYRGIHPGAHVVAHEARYAR